ncbi:MAG: hypothetical protein K5Q00_05765 [Gammaproteobacteria bacterium]|nr:hypothetical protein [Gammaproteobacteria bacterium]
MVYKFHRRNGDKLIFGSDNESPSTITVSPLENQCLQLEEIEGAGSATIANFNPRAPYSPEHVTTIAILDKKPYITLAQGSKITAAKIHGIFAAAHEVRQTNYQPVKKNKSNSKRSHLPTSVEPAVLEKDNPVIKQLASQVQACINIRDTDLSGEVIVGEFGLTIKGLAAPPLAPAYTAWLPQPLPVTPGFTSVDIFQIHPSLPNVLWLCFADEEPVLYEIGQPVEGTVLAHYENALGSIHQLAARVIHKPAFHQISRNYHHGRAVIEKFAGALLDGKLPGSSVPGIVIFIMAALSSFSMSDALPHEEFKTSMLFLGMIGGGAFNYLGGRDFSGFTKSKKDMFYIIWGLLSAISPAVMTIFGVTAFGIPWGFGILCGFANFILSGALGYEGLHGISKTIKDFYYSSWSKSVAIFEIVIYILLACYLSLARIQAGFKFMLCGPVDHKCVPNPDDHSFASYWTSVAASTLCNIPELLLFVECYLRLRMRIQQAWQAGQRPKGWGHLVSFVLALFLGLSFFVTFKAVGEQAWDQSFNAWFATIEGKLAALFRTHVNSVVEPGDLTGLGAGLLVVGAGEGVYEMGTVFWNGLRQLGNCIRAKNSGAAPNANAPPSFDGETPQTETTPLLHNRITAARDDEVEGYKIIGSAATRVKIKQREAESKISPWHIPLPGFSWFNQWLVDTCGSTNPPLRLPGPKGTRR